MSIAILPALRAERVTWAPVASVLHVASRAGEYVGYAEQTADGHFVGFDGRSTPVGRYETLADAKRAVESATSDAETVRSPRVHASAHAAAAVSGIVALGTLAAAVLTMPGL